AFVIHQVIHPDVVLGDVLPGGGLSLSDAQVHIGWNTFIEALCQANFGPLPTRPCRTVFQTLIQRGERKIQNRGECEFVVEEIVDDMSRWIVPPKCFVEGTNGTKVEIHLLAEFTIDLVHMSIKLLEQLLEAVEHCVESSLISGKAGANEVFVRGGIAVLV